MNYHQPVMLAECIEGLNIKPEGIYVDVTYGGGGHSAEILKKLTTGKLIAFDQDEDAIKNIIEDKRLIFVHHNYRFLKNFLRYHKIKSVDGILADLGISSHHIDAANRGFSFRFEGNLDMRMNTSGKQTAADIVNTYTERELARVFAEYGELPIAQKLAYQVVSKRSETNKINTIQQFVDIIKLSIPRQNEHKFLAQVFQALRIEVNNELRNLEKMLLQTCEVLKPGGRLVVMTYHSLEDRIVKNFIKSGNFEGKLDKDFYGNVLSPFKALNKNVIIPTDKEIEINNRARSAKLRIAEKIEINVRK
jgi:16S rRNA (cytosine1402-N4)-methyltransferase